MSYSNLPTVATGDIWTAALHNQYIKNNFAASVPDFFTAKGDLLVASGASNMSNLAIGSDGTPLVADTAEALGMKWGGLSDIIIRGSWGWSVGTQLAGEISVDVTTMGLPSGTKYLFGSMGTYYSATGSDTTGYTVLTTSADTTIIYAKCAYIRDVCRDYHPYICKVDEDKIIVSLFGNTDQDVSINVWGYS